jgi:hypothetical protein
MRLVECSPAASVTSLEPPGRPRAVARLATSPDQAQSRKRNDDRSHLDYDGGDPATWDSCQIRIRLRRRVTCSLSRRPHPAGTSLRRPRAIYPAAMGERVAVGEQT